MSEGSFAYQYFQLDAGNGEMRVFKSRPHLQGQLAFIPNAPAFYLTAIDTDGYEHLVDIFDDREAALSVADKRWRDFGVRGLHDRTVTGVPEVYRSYASPDGWAYIRLEGGTEAPRPSKAPWTETWVPDGPCWYAFAVTTDGLEWPVYVGYDEADARQLAQAALEEYGVSDLVDLTRMGTA